MSLDWPDLGSLGASIWLPVRYFGAPLELSWGYIEAPFWLICGSFGAVSEPSWLQQERFWDVPEDVFP